MVWDCLVCCFFPGKATYRGCEKLMLAGLLEEPSCTEERQEEETEVCGKQAAADEKEQPFFVGGCPLSIIQAAVRHGKSDQRFPQFTFHRLRGFCGFLFLWIHIRMERFLAHFLVSKSCGGRSPAAYGWMVQLWTLSLRRASLESRVFSGR